MNFRFRPSSEILTARTALPSGGHKAILRATLAPCALNDDLRRALGGAPGRIDHKGVRGRRRRRMLDLGRRRAGLQQGLGDLATRRQEAMHRHKHRLDRLPGLVGHGAE
eukprot:15435999-Alexandrium_andersonii.AAC.1